MEMVLGFAFGLAIGGAYLGALWITVRRIPDAAHPGALVLGSYLTRLAVAGAGFYGVMRLGGAAGLVAALAGFLLMRHLLMRRVGGSGEESMNPETPWS